MAAIGACHISIGSLPTNSSNTSGTPNIATYAVTYNGNGNTGGSVPVDSNTYAAGATVTVRANSGNLVKSGYTFVGWNTQANGAGASYPPGTTFNMGTANVTLYAFWTTATTYTVTYNGNGNTGGSLPVGPNNYTSGTTVTILGNTGALVKTGYGFSGWNTAANGSGTNYKPGATLTVGSANVTLYAQWAYYLDMINNMSGGTGGLSAYSLSGGVPVALSGSPYNTGSAGGPNGVAVSPDGNHLYVTNANSSTGTGGLSVYTLSGGVPTALSGSPYNTGVAGYPRHVAISPDGNYLYVTNGGSTNGTGGISGYSLSGGVPTALSGSPYNTGSAGGPNGVAVGP